MTRLPAAYLALAERLAAAHPGVSLGSGRPGFGSTTLNLNGRMVAMWVKHQGFAVKLAPARVAALAQDGTGEPLRMGSRVMRAWLLVASADAALWQRLAEEALGVAAARGPA